MPNTQVFFYFLIFLEQCNYFDVFKDKANITLSQSFFFLSFYIDFIVNSKAV
jgi:hypothetical protein